MLFSDDRSIGAKNDLGFFSVDMKGTEDKDKTRKCSITGNALEPIVKLKLRGKKTTITKQSRVTFLPY